MAREMTPQEQAAAVVAREIVGIIDGLAYIDPNDHRKCEEAIRPLIQQTRRAALLEASKAICPYCNDPEWGTISEENPAMHISPVTKNWFDCKGWPIRKLAQEG